MLVQYLGDQAQYLGLMRLMGTAFVGMALYEARRVRIRRALFKRYIFLNRRLPNQRLQIDGEHYVC